MLVNFCKTVWRHIPGDSYKQIHRSENLKSHIDYSTHRFSTSLTYRAISIQESWRLRNSPLLLPVLSHMNPLSHPPILFL
jgi:hypothetical protein